MDRRGVCNVLQQNIQRWYLIRAVIWTERIKTKRRDFSDDFLKAVRGVVSSSQKGGLGGSGAVKGWTNAKWP